MSRRVERPKPRNVASTASSLVRLVLVVLVAALFVPLSTANQPTPPWKFDIEVDGSGNVGSIITITLDVLSRRGGQDVRLELEVPSSLSRPETAAYILDFDEGQRRTLTWETTVQKNGFWAAQVVFTADPSSYGDPVNPDVKEYSYVADAVYGFTHKTLSRVSTDAMEVLPGPAEGTVRVRFVDEGNGRFEVNATLLTTTEWVRWGNVSGGGNILNATNVTHGRGFQSLSLTLRDTLPPGWGAYGSVEFNAMPFWDSPRPVDEPSYVSIACQGISVVYAETGALSFSDQGECPRARSTTPSPGLGIVLLSVLASVVFIARKR